MRFGWLVLLTLATLPLAGCEVAAAMFSAMLWVSGLFLVLIIFLITFIAIKVRGS
jgi:hypothetical protein